jgi:hypothetical protein
MRLRNSAVPERAIAGNADPELGIVTEQFRRGERFETKFVCGVRRVRDQLSKEYLLVAVQGVNHQLQQLTYFRLET